MELLIGISIVPIKAEACDYYDTSYGLRGSIGGRAGMVSGEGASIFILGEKPDSGARPGRGMKIIPRLLQ